MIKIEEKPIKCSICRKFFHGFGNNPFPLKIVGRCCNECNAEVIKERLRKH